MNEKNLEINRLNYIFVNVSEKISQVNEKSFILTSLKSNNIDVSKKTKIFFTYLYQTCEYQISYYETFDNKQTVALNLKKDIGFEPSLLIQEGCFMVFLKNRLYYYQKMDVSISEEELLEYVQNRLNITIIRVYCEDLLFIGTKNNPSSSSLQYINTKNSYAFFLYASYIIGIVSLLLWHFLYFQSHVQNTEKKKIKRLQKEYLSKVNSSKYNLSVSFDLKKIYAKAEELNLQMLYLKIQKKSYLLTLTALDKERLYTFLKEYESHIVHQKIDYEKSTKYYELQTQIKFN